MWYIYTMKYYSVIKKEVMNKIMPSIATWMDPESVIHSKSEKDKYHMILLISLWMVTAAMKS